MTEANRNGNLIPVSESLYHPDLDNNPWWDQLPEDFFRHSEKFELEMMQSLKVNFVSVGDYFTRTLLGSIVALTNIRELMQTVQKKNRETWDFYKNPDFLTNPSLFYKKPEKIRVVSKPGEQFLINLSDAVIEDLSFTSPFVPVQEKMRFRPEFSKGFSSAFARHIRHPEGPRATIICMHGFYLDPYEANSYVFDIPFLYNLGLDILLYTLPFHGPRKLENALFSGDGFITTDVAAINEHMAHSIHDFRVFLDYLEQRNVPSIGVTGVSLGGYHSALLAGIEERLDYAIPIIPLVSIIDLALEWEPIGIILRNLLKGFKYTVSDIRHAMSVHSPLSFKSTIPKENLMVIAGLGDRMASPKHARLLWEHWGRPKMHWFPGNHFVHLDRGAYFAEIEEFLRKINII